MKELEKHDYKWAEWDFGAHGNMIAFQTGFGDGFYGSYWGYDAAGEIVALVADFAVLPEPSAQPSA